LYKLIVFLCLVLLPSLVSAKQVVENDIPLNKQIVRTAREFKGINYNFGGDRIANGLDCSSFVQKIYGFYGIMLPRVAAEQYEYGDVIQSTNQLRAGDLVFFETYRPGPSHVGIYSDKDPMFIHASSSQGVTETSLRSSYFNDRYYGAKRVLNVSEFAKATDEPKIVEETKTVTLIQKSKECFKESAEALKKRIKEVAEFQAKKKFLAKQKLEMDGVGNYVKANLAKIKSVCPVVFDKPVKTYVYNTEHKTNALRLTPTFGEVMYVIGSSKALDLGVDGKLITKACLLTADKKNIDLIDSRSLSFFPAEDITDKNCLQATPINKEVVVKIKTAQLRLYNNDYENVFGNLVPSYKLIVGAVNNGTKLKAVGIVADGDRKGDYCIVYKNNVVIAYEGDVK